MLLVNVLINVFSFRFSFVSSTSKGTEGMCSMNNWSRESSLLRVRRRHSCWPFNQRNCRSIKFEPVPILSNDNALCALVFHEIEKFLSLCAVTPSSIMKYSHRTETFNVCSLKLIELTFSLRGKNYSSSVNTLSSQCHKISLSLID